MKQKSYPLDSACYSNLANCVIKSHLLYIRGLNLCNPHDYIIKAYEMCVIEDDVLSEYKNILCRNLGCVLQQEDFFNGI